MMKRYAGLLVLVMFTLSTVGTSRLLADEGRIPLLSLPGPPFVITAPGHYILTEDVTFAGNIILIQSHQVTVDLNGFNLTGASGFPVIVIDSATASFFVTIRNGTLSQGSTGIQHVGLNRLRVRIENVTVNAMDIRGISLDRAAHAEIVSCHVRNIFGDDGIFVSGFSALLNGRIVDNEVTGVGGFGIRVEGLQGGEIRRNIASFWGLNAGVQAGLMVADVGAGAGLGAGGNIIEGNVVGRPQGAADEGINLTSADGNLIENNVVKANTAAGIRLQDSSRNRLHKNAAHGNTGDGMETAGASDANLFLENITGDNGGLGIDCAGVGNNARGNLFFGDGLGGLCIDAGGNIL